MDETAAEGETQTTRTAAPVGKEPAHGDKRDARTTLERQLNPQETKPPRGYFTSTRHNGHPASSECNNRGEAQPLAFRPHCCGTAVLVHFVQNTFTNHRHHTERVITKTPMRSISFAPYLERKRRSRRRYRRCHRRRRRRRRQCCWRPHTRRHTVVVVVVVMKILQRLRGRRLVDPPRLIARTKGLLLLHHRRMPMVRQRDLQRLIERRNAHMPCRRRCHRRRRSRRQRGRRR